VVIAPSQPDHRPRLPKRWAALFASGLMAAAGLSGCTSLGATRIAVDRGDYADRLRESDKDQLLSNIVALRFGDGPLFLQVASVTSQYAREISANARGNFNRGDNDEAAVLTANASLRETPTITYTPMTGEKFAHDLLSPISPVSLLAMMQVGWNADDLFRVAVRSINGVRNLSRAPMFALEPAGDFPGLALAFRRLQQSGGLSLRVHEDDKAYVAEVQLAANLTPEQSADVAFLRTALGGQGGPRAPGSDLRIVFAGFSSANDQLAISTRSMFAILEEMGQGVDMAGDGRFAPDVLVRVQSGPRPPKASFAAVRYHERWFWIDADDETSKRAFLIAQVLMSLSDDAGNAKAPLVVIPAG